MGLHEDGLGVIADDREAGGHSEKVNGQADEHSFSDAGWSNHHLESCQKFSLFADFDLASLTQTRFYNCLTKDIILSTSHIQIFKGHPLV